MLLSAVSVLVAVQPSPEVPEGLMNYPLLSHCISSCRRGDRLSPSVLQPAVPASNDRTVHSNGGTITGSGKQKTW
jgi:hypothetical protein